MFMHIYSSFASYSVVVVSLAKVKATAWTHVFATGGTPKKSVQKKRFEK